ncbi:MAG: DUF4159 domain-containing protein [Alphaproteobacteria bacterium]|nr:MAG: DUF4159 domain-containing protein [Alphaproteobacteria bacterium]
MLSFGALSFAAPWILLAGALLPAIWLLLKITPPAPRRVRFPALMLLRGLAQPEETPRHTPWWLLLLRLVMAALVILGLAQPLLNPVSGLPGSGPLVLVIDDGWAAGKSWEATQATALDWIDRADRDGRTIALLTTAAQPGGEPPDLISPRRASDIRNRVRALQPKPWPTDRARALAALEARGLASPAQTVWLSDGLGDPAASRLAARLQEAGSLRVLHPTALDLAVLALPPEARPGDLEIPLRRARAGEVQVVAVRALGADGRLLAREMVRFEATDTRTIARVRLPAELRNRIARIDIDGEAQAGAVVLLDSRFERRPVGVVSASVLDSDRSLLDDGYYLERALLPFAELRRGPVADLLRAPPSMILLPDAIPLSPADRTELQRFVERGGVLVRFAGPRLAEAQQDDLAPVRLRPGNRQLGTALQWSEPQRLQPFDERSPFVGLTVPDDVTIARQVLAEPSATLAERTWARLADGTPLVTGDARGEGHLVLFHVQAAAEWSSLPISGLFVDMLRRLVQLGRGVGGAVGGAPLPALETLDGFGRLVQAPATAGSLAAGSTEVGPRTPPGFYGTESVRRALSLGQSVTETSPLSDLPSGTVLGTLGQESETVIGPWLLLAALVLALIDLVLALILRGLLRPRLAGSAAAGLVLALVSIAPVDAQTGPRRSIPEGPDGFALGATLDTRLAYVTTGARQVDEVSRSGLRGLSILLNRRTAVEAADPVAVDLESDELAFFPLIYWPITPDQRPLSPQAVERVNTYLRTGGTILFDTRDDGAIGFGPGAGTRRLRELTRGIDIPPLTNPGADHVLTKTFYLLTEFPGRSAGGPLWVDARDTGIDEVASVIVGANDYAAAWAVDANGRPMFAVTPGGEQQREMAYRFGINLVMYALTGNYKADQVHVPAILERLSQ